MTTKVSAPASVQDAALQPSASGGAPIIVDMGKKSRKDIRKLRKGKAGRLMSRVAETIAHLKENGAVAEGVQVVVFVVKEKPKQRGKRVAKMWGLG